MNSMRGFLCVQPGGSEKFSSTEAIKTQLIAGGPTGFRLLWHEVEPIAQTANGISLPLRSVDAVRPSASNGLDLVQYNCRSQLIMPLLSLITFLPLLGVLFLLLVRGEERTVESNAFWMALWVSLVTLFLALLAWFTYDRTLGGFQFVEEREWLPALGLSYRLGVDGISLPFVVLSALLTPIVIVASRMIQERARTYMILFLVLETLMIGSFCALDLFLFYIFFEGVLIPMFLIIGIWGGPRRIYATFKFFLYTLAGSLLMLLALLALRHTQGTSDITLATRKRPGGQWPATLDVACFLCFLCGEDSDVACAYLAS